MIIMKIKKRKHKQIGEGSFGKIYKVKDKNNKEFAMKKILISSMDEVKALSSEYELLASLNKFKLNLISIHGMETKQLDKTTGVLYILMDLALRDWDKEIEQREKIKKYYTENELKKIMKELIFTFSELQRHSISHRDIKPQNVLLFADNTFRIADFGEAKEVITRNRKETFKQTIRGTELYMSPILFKAINSKRVYNVYTKHNTYKSDVFSLGLCFLLAATLTYQSLCDIREIEDMEKVKSIIEGYLKKRYSNEFLQFLFVMLDLNEKTRPDFKELVKISEKF